MKKTKLFAPTLALTLLSLSAVSANAQAISNTGSATTEITTTTTTIVPATSASSSSTQTRDVRDAVRDRDLAEQPRQTSTTITTKNSGVVEGSGSVMGGVINGQATTDITAPVRIQTERTTTETTTTQTPAQ